MSEDVRAYSFYFPIKGISKDNGRHFGKQGMYFLPKKFRDFEKELRRYFYEQKAKNFQPYEKTQDLNVLLKFTFKTKVHCDTGNLPKSILDAFNKILWYDDKQIKRLAVEVNYGDCDSIHLNVSNIVRGEPNQ